MLCTFAAFAQSKTEQYSKRDFLKLSTKSDALLNEAVAFNEAVGIAAGIYRHDGQTWYGTSGFMDKENKIAVNDSMIHRIASIAKPMTAVAILQLYEQNKLKLNDPIQKYLPYFPRKDEGEITILNLLNHTSGLKAYLSESEAFNTKQYESLQDAISVFMDRDLLFAPGSDYHYTTYGYVVLGAIIEKVAGISYRDYMKKNIWDKAGMKHTDVERFGKEYNNKSKLYRLDHNGHLVPDIETDLSVKVPGGGLYSTIGDLINFGRAILDHRLIQPTTLELMIQDAGVKDGGNPYVMGWFIYGDQNDPRGLTIGHSGSQSGTSAQFMIHLEKKVVVAVLSNTGDTWPKVFDLTEKLSLNVIDKKALKKPLPSVISFNSTDFIDHIGTYKNAENNREMIISMEADKPFINVNGMRSNFQMYPTSRDKFFIRWGDITIEFEGDMTKGTDALILTENKSSSTYFKVEPKKRLISEVDRLINEFKMQAVEDLLDSYNKDQFEIESEELNALGLRLLDEGKSEEALFLYKKYRALFPDDLLALEGLARTYLSMGKEADAQEYFKKSSELYAGDGFYQMSVHPPSSYKPTIIPSDTASLFEHRGNLKKQVVFVFLQGGPDPFLSIDNRRDPFSALPERDDILRVYPYQAQMLNHTIFSPHSEISKKAAIYENKQSAEILNRVILYFKARGKKVYVFTHSFGSQLLLEYLENYQNTADELILMGARLDNNIENYLELGPGQLIRWENGIRPFVSNWHSNYPAMPLIRAEFEQVIQNTKQLVIVHREKQFSKILSQRDLSNLTFVHAKFDEASGRVYKEELSFLMKKGAKTIGTYGDHHSMLSRNYMEHFYQSLKSNTAAKPSLAFELSEKLEGKGLSESKKWLAQISDFSNYFIDQNEINNLGYEWLQNGFVNEAIEIFKINIEQFPYSWNVYDSLGEAYMANKQKEEAIKYYRRSLELNPENQYGMNALKLLITE